MIRKPKQIPNFKLDIYTDIEPQTVEYEGYTFKVEFHNDDFPDTSFYGEYTNKPDWYNGCLIIDREKNGDMGYHEYRYWQGANPLDDSRKWYHANGYSKHDSWLLPRQHAFEDYKRMEALNKGHWCYIGVTVTNLDTEQSESIWGIESDCEEYINGEVYDLITYLIPKNIKDLTGVEMQEVA